MPKEWLRSRMKSIGRWMGAWLSEITPRRAAAMVAAVLLWVSMGGMTASVSLSATAQEGFGEVHWYIPDKRYGQYPLLRL